MLHVVNAFYQTIEREIQTIMLCPLMPSIYPEKFMFIALHKHENMPKKIMKIFSWVDLEDFAGRYAFKVQFSFVTDHIITNIMGLNNIIDFYKWREVYLLWGSGSSKIVKSFEFENLLLASWVTAKMYMIFKDCHYWKQPIVVILKDVEIGKGILHGNIGEDVLQLSTWRGAWPYSHWSGLPFGALNLMATDETRKKCIS